MSVAFDATDRLFTNEAPLTDRFTVAGWLRMSSSVVDTRPVFQLLSEGGGSSTLVLSHRDSIGLFATLSGQATSAFSYTANTWYYVALSRAANPGGVQLRVWLDTATTTPTFNATSGSASTNATPFKQLAFGDADGSATFVGDFVGWKVWTDVVLTDADLELERHKYRAVTQIAKVFSVYPLWNGTIPERDLGPGTRRLLHRGVATGSAKPSQLTAREPLIVNLDAASVPLAGPVVLEAVFAVQSAGVATILVELRDRGQLRMTRTTFVSSTTALAITFELTKEERSALEAFDALQVDIDVLSGPALRVAEITLSARLAAGTGAQNLVAPNSLVALLTGGTVQCRFIYQNAGEGSYRLYRNTNGGAFAQIASTTTGAGTARGVRLLTDTTPSVGVTHGYYVVAVLGSVESVPSTVQYVQT